MPGQVVSVGGKVAEYVRNNPGSSAVAVTMVAVAGIWYAASQEAAAEMNENNGHANADEDIEVVEEQKHCEADEEPSREPQVSKAFFDDAGHTGMVVTKEQRIAVLGECVICCDEPANLMLMPCLHRTCCADCFSGNDLRSCPLCREEITQSVVMA